MNLAAFATHHARSPLLRCASALLLVIIATTAHAATYRCTDAHAATTFQDAPCASGEGQHEIALQPQPLIGDGTVHADNGNRIATSSAHAHSRKPTRIAAHARKQKMPVSWECHAADGEVFYRHTRCPSSVPGDGVARDAYMEQQHARTQNAWSRVPVHGVKIARAEACERIRSPSAAARDGHDRDENVSVYDHLMGRDPCDGF